MRTLLLPLLLILTSACNNQQVEGETSTGAINAAAPYVWPANSFPKTLKVSTAFNADESTAIGEMGSAWETSIQNKADFFNTSGTTSELPTNVNLDSIGSDGVMGIYKLTRWPASLSGSALAVTQIFGRRYNIGSSSEYVQISHADILVNYDYYDFRTTDTGIYSSYDFRTVILHEMGHFLGLPHKYGTTVMTPAVGTSTKIQAPKSVDILDISDKYGLSTGGGASAIAASKPLFYKPMNGDQGQELKLLIELRADGECRHYENGALIERHSAKTK